MLYFLALLIAMAPLTLDAYLPAFPAIAANLGVLPVEINFSISTFLLGLAIGMLVCGPLSDQLGRKPIALAGLLICAICSVAMLWVNDLTSFLLLRIPQAIGCGAVSVTVMPTIRDVSLPQQVAGRNATVYLIMLISPMVAPFIGAALLPLGWRAIFLFIAAYAAVLALVYLRLIPETRESSGSLRWGRILQQYRQVLCYRMDGHWLSIRYSLSASMANCVLLVFITNSSFIFQTWYGVSERVFPLFFGLNVACIATVQFVSSRVLRRLKLWQIAGYYRMGQRLQLTILAAVALANLVWQLPLAVFVLVLAPALACVGINAPSGSGVYLAGFKQLSGSATALLTTGNFLFGGLLGALSAHLNQGNLNSFLFTILGASLLANLILLSIPRPIERSVMEKLDSGEIQPL